MTDPGPGAVRIHGAGEMIHWVMVAPGEIVDIYVSRTGIRVTRSEENEALLRTEETP